MGSTVGLAGMDGGIVNKNFRFRPRKYSPTVQPYRGSLVVLEKKEGEGKRKRTKFFNLTSCDPIADFTF